MLILRDKHMVVMHLVNKWLRNTHPLRSIKLSKSLLLGLVVGIQSLQYLLYTKYSTNVRYDYY